MSIDSTTEQKRKALINAQMGISALQYSQYCAVRNTWNILCKAPLHCFKLGDGKTETAYTMHASLVCWNIWMTLVTSQNA